MAQSVKIAISLPKELLQEIDVISRKFHRSRSATLREALQMLLEKYKDAETLKRAKKIYHEAATSDRDLSEKYAQLVSEMLPPYDSQGER